MHGVLDAHELAHRVDAERVGQVGDEHVAERAERVAAVHASLVEVVGGLDELERGGEVVVGRLGVEACLERLLERVARHHARVNDPPHQVRVHARVDGARAHRALGSCAFATRAAVVVVVVGCCGCGGGGRVVASGRRRRGAAGGCGAGTGGEARVEVLVLVAYVLDIVGSHELAYELAAREPADVVLERIVVGVPVLEAAVAEEALDHVLDAEEVEAGASQLRRLLRGAYGRRPRLERGQAGRIGRVVRVIGALADCAVGQRDDLLNLLKVARYGHGRRCRSCCRRRCRRR